MVLHWWWGVVRAEREREREGKGEGGKGGEGEREARAERSLDTMFMRTRAMPGLSQR